MVKAGKVYATATEDMDALTFGSPVLLRHMTFSEARKMPIQEFQLDSVLETMEMTRDEVILTVNSKINIYNIFIFLVYRFVYTVRM